MPKRMLAFFCPAFTSASLARRFGVSYVLEQRGATSPSGGIYVATMGNEKLFKIPGAGFATVAPLVRGRSSTARQKEPVVPRVRHPDPGTWQVVTGDHVQDLRLRLTDVPGWHATIDGRRPTSEPPSVRGHNAAGDGSSRASRGDRTVLAHELCFGIGPGRPGDSRVGRCALRWSDTPPPR